MMLICSLHSCECGTVPSTLLYQKTVILLIQQSQFRLPLHTDATQQYRYLPQTMQSAPQLGVSLVQPVGKALFIAPSMHLIIYIVLTKT